MRPIRSINTALVALLAAAGCTEDGATTTAPTAVPAPASATIVESYAAEPEVAGHLVRQSASGHGNLTVNGAFRTFSFTAMRRKDGEVDGRFELHNHATGVRLHGEVTCFLAFARPLDPDRGAFFAGGVITHSDGTVPEGTPVIFSAFDNGEGRNAVFPDFLSLMQPTSPNVVQRHCAIGLRIGMPMPIEGGNIQVRP